MAGGRPTALTADTQAKIVTAAGDALNAKVAGKPCRVCGTFQRIEAHHIVRSSKMLGGLGKHHGQLHHPFNLMPLCHDHHVAHHTQGRAYRVPRDLLTPGELAFVLEHAPTPSWVDNWYPRTPTTGDPTT